MNRVFIIIGIVLGCLCCHIRAHGQNTSSAYNFLDIPGSAHAFALGGTNIAIVDDDVTLAAQNPALIGPELERQASFGYMHYLGSGNFASANFGMAAGEYGAWGIGMRYLNYGEFQGYDHNGTATGSFTPSDIVVEGTYSHDITDRLRGGINVKMIFSNYEQYSAFAMAADLGINYYDDEKDLSLSAVLKNMGGQIKRFDNDYCRLPFDIQLGYMQGLGTSPFQLSINAVGLTRWRLPYYKHKTDSSDNSDEPHQTFMSNLFRHLIFGLQYSPSDRFYIALGYNYRTRTDMAGYSRNFLSGFSAGVGLRVKSFALGVAYAMPHSHGSSLMLNLNLSF